MKEDMEELKRDILKELREDIILQELKKVTAPKITKSQILEIKDDKERQKAISENLHLFDN